MKKIPFNIPSIVGNEIKYIQAAINNKHLSGDGLFSKKCKSFFLDRYKFQNVFLTTSCSDALEMISVLLNLDSKSEVIVPSFSFVSCANAFETHGGKVVFVDTEIDFPNISYKSISEKITNNTKAVLVIHYAGYPCEIDKISALCKKNKIILIEDCAHAIDVKYKNKYLGLYGDFSTFSFHETKNLTCGEGGMLVLNNKNYLKQITQIYNKGTNRSDFNNRLVSKYQWTNYGASYLLSDLNAAFLLAQLEKLKSIQDKRISIFNTYLKELNLLKKTYKNIIPNVFYNKKTNAHIFYLLCQNKNQRKDLLSYLNSKKIFATFHYLPLEKSTFYKKKYNNKSYNPNSSFFSDRIIRLPIYFSLKPNDQKRIIKEVINFFLNHKN